MHASILVTSLLTGFAVSANAIATISVKGAKFFTSDGDQFYVKGTWMIPCLTYHAATRAI